ncbi:hypothetical protein BH20BAC1_BH20BAC1_24280 [soil metagenome]
MKHLLLNVSLAVISLAGISQSSNQSSIAFGEAFNSISSISADELQVKLKHEDSFNGIVLGKVNSVCQVKGCWMKLRTTAGKDIMVQFKDYKFFVPKDIDGKMVMINGEARNNEIPVETLRHYAKDAGKSTEDILKITQPENQIVFVASGVQVVEK